MKFLYWALDLRQHKIIRYLISGGTAAATNLFIFSISHLYFGLWYISASAAAFIVSFFVSFTLQKFWTFGDNSLDVVEHQVAKYLLVALLNLGANTLILYALVEHLRLHALLGQIITIGVVAVWSYFIYQHLIFRNTLSAESHV
jgi:putative flippase GtrA